MSAIDPLRRGQRGLRRFRTVETIDRNGGDDPAQAPRRSEILKCTYRPGDADFYCWKYGVWYNLMDCCYRHDRRTFPGCAGCGQGASNLKVHQARYDALRPHRDRSTHR